MEKDNIEKEIQNTLVEYSNTIGELVTILITNEQDENYEEAQANQNRIDYITEHTINVFKKVFDKTGVENEVAEEIVEIKNKIINHLRKNE